MVAGLGEGKRSGKAAQATADNKNVQLEECGATIIEFNGLRRMGVNPRCKIRNNDLRPKCLWRTPPRMLQRTVGWVAWWGKWLGIAQNWNKIRILTLNKLASILTH